MYDYDRYCIICDWLIEDDDPLIWRGIIFTDVCSLLECREKLISELEGEAE